MKDRQRNILILKLIILIILLIILILCSFKTGERFYILQNTEFDTTVANTTSGIARWYFNATIIY